MSFSEHLSRANRQIKYILISNTFRVSTWLALGSILQLLSLLSLPRKLSILAPILLVFHRIAKAISNSRHIYTSVFSDVRRGRWTTWLPPSKSDEDESGVVMFVLGARVNHPQGRRAANALELGKLYNAMWEEAEANRFRWGYLGRTQMLTSCGDEEGFTFVWLTYWRDIKGLHEFAKCTAHRAGQKAYVDDKKFPYMGIMHELYFARKGSTETLYHNFPPFGMGQTKLIVDEGAGPILKDPLVPDQQGGSTMYERMRGTS